MKIIQFLAAMILFILINLRCRRDLDQPPFGLVDESKMTNKESVEGLLIAAYSLLDGSGLANQQNAPDFTPWPSAASNWVYGSICGSEGHKGSEFESDDQQEILQIEKFETTPQNAYMERKWAAVYAGVQRANTVLRIMKKATDINEQDQKRIAGEARFLRGFYHFEAMKMWNKVPYVDETITYENLNYYVPNDTLIWGAIENDFRFAADNLTAIMGAPGRANMYAAKAFLAKALLFQAREKPVKYVEAKVLLEEIINNGVTADGIKYALLPHYSDNFNAEFKNSCESVFAAQASVNDGTYGLNSNMGDVLNLPHNQTLGYCCGFFQPTQFLVNHFKTDPSSGLPYLDTFNDEDVKNDWRIPSTDTFTIYDGTLDARIDWTVGRRGIPYLDWGDHPGKDWIRDLPENFGPYSPKKNSYYKSQEDLYTDATGWANGMTAMNVNLIRFADVLLWAAEVEIEIGDPLKAMVFINQVRARAADQSGWVLKSSGPYAPNAAKYKVGLYTAQDFENQEHARKILRFERLLELGMEGHRFFDLVRWGIAKEEIQGYLDKEKYKRTYLMNVTFKKDVNEYFPIPQSQIDLSAGPDGKTQLKQNPGY